SVIAPGFSLDEAEDAIGQVEDADLVLAFFAGRAPTGGSPPSDWESFLAVKRETLRQGALSLCLWESDTRTPARETALRVAQLLGHAPFTLGAPLPFTDDVVGLIHTPKASMTVVFQATGVFIGYSLHRGELDATGAAKLLPETFFKGSHVVVGTLSALPDEATAALYKHAKSVGVTLHINTVGAGANPNLYAFAGGKVGQPTTGTAFLSGEDTALLVPAMPAHPAAPVNPLHITTDEALPVADALRTVLAFNTLHATARKPRLPLHLVHTAAIKRLLEAGVYPRANEGAEMWWL
ncbi:MAG: hypothetical protein AAF125_24530, partial [Chloroflexota bacterium]